MTDQRPRATSMNRQFDDVFEHVRSFSCYQRLLFSGVCFMIYAANGQFTALVFAMGTPKFHCDTPNVTCPDSKCCLNCTSYVFNGPYYSTVSEWNLICDRAYLGATLQSCYFVGMLIGSIVNGIISDAWGRKKCMLISYSLMILSSVASTFVDCSSFYGLLQFMVGFTLTGAMLCGYTFGMEIVGPKRRTLAACINDFFWQLFVVINTGQAYLVRDWRMIVLVYTVPGVLLLPFWRLIPESPRWLVAHGRLEEALQVLIKFGGKRGKPVDKDVLKDLIQEVREEQVAREQDETKTYTPLDMLRTPKNRKWSLIMCYNWFVVGIVFFGVFIFISQLAGDIYVNYVIMAVINIFRVPVTWFLFTRIGRRISHAAFIFLTGILFLIVLAFYKDYPLAATSISIVGYVLIYGNFVSVYIITSELFPTVLRNSALGSGSFSARVGAIVAPYIAMVGQLPGLTLAVPATIFGVVSIIAGLLFWWIPETVHATMRQTIEEAESAVDYYGIPCCGKPLTEDAEPEELVVKEPLIDDQEGAKNDDQNMMCMSSV